MSTTFDINHPKLARVGTRLPGSFGPCRLGPHGPNRDV